MTELCCYSKLSDEKKSSLHHGLQGPIGHSPDLPYSAPQHSILDGSGGLHGVPLAHQACSDLRTFALIISSAQNTLPPVISEAWLFPSFRPLLRCHLVKAIPTSSHTPHKTIHLVQPTNVTPQPTYLTFFFSRALISLVN